jgi:hypothetical protein
MATDNIIGTFFEKSEGRAYELNEGNVSIDTGYSTINGAKQTFFKFANPVEAENFLEFDLANGELLMKGATTKATHITMYDAEFPSGSYPTAPVTDGSYKRFVTAFKLKTGELQLPLADDNVAITSGDYLCLDAYNTGLDKYTGSTATMKVCQALESKSANSGGYILCYLHNEEIPFLE